jgi:hypothetical protein
MSIIRRRMFPIYMHLLGRRFKSILLILVPVESSLRACLQLHNTILLSKFEIYQSMIPMIITTKARMSRPLSLHNSQTNTLLTS